MDAGATLKFAMVARRLGAATRAMGLVPPAFRSPPRVDGAVRTIRRYQGGSVVSVNAKKRPFDQVVADMVEGVVVANNLDGESAARVRSCLRNAIACEEVAREASLGEARVAKWQTQAA